MNCIKACKLECYDKVLSSYWHQPPLKDFVASACCPDLLRLAGSLLSAAPLLCSGSALIPKKELLNLLFFPAIWVILHFGGIWVLPKSLTKSRVNKEVIPAVNQYGFFSKSFSFLCNLQRQQMVVITRFNFGLSMLNHKWLLEAGFADLLQLLSL